MNPIISVIINTYNYGRFIEEAIDSVLAQDFPAEQREILVVDDGSTDDTAERVKKYGDRIRYLYKENGDQCSAVAFGAAHSTGDLLAFLDGDDLWFPNKLSRVAREFEKHPAVVMVYNKLLYWDSRDNSVWEADEFADVSGDVPSDLRKLLTYTVASTSALAFRRDSYKRLAGVPSSRAFSYDIYLNIAALFLGPVACIPEPLTKYRVHGGNRWFAGRLSSDPTTIRRRMGRQAAAIEIIRDWAVANVPESLPKVDILLDRWRLHQRSDGFQLRSPGRLQSFLHHARYNLIYGPVMTPGTRAYSWAYAFVILLVGKHAHYMEGARTRARRIAAYFRQRLGPAETQ